MILYELLTGTTPLEKQRFKEAAWHEMLRLIKEEEPPRPSARLGGSAMLPSLAAQRQLEPVKLTKLLRGELDWIVMKCLEKERSRRYDTANGLARDVERYLADELVEARPASAGYRLRKFVRRNKVRVLGVGAVAALLFLVIGLVTYGIWWAERQSAERRHEQELMAARTNDTIKATLDQAEAALKAGRIAQTSTLLDQANRQMEEKTRGDLRDRYERLEKDKKTVEELNDIFEERWLFSRSDIRLDNTKAKLRYPDVFKHYGLALGKEPAAQIVEKIHGSVIADALASGMAEWFFVDPKYQGLLALVDLLDPDPGRATLRAAIVNNEIDRVKEIGKTIDGSRLTPAYAIGLGTDFGIRDNGFGMPILKAAWTAHPNSFALALTISSRTIGHDATSAMEKVGWGRTAVALRPNNPLAHYYLALALERGLHDIDQAAEELRRAIQLGPRFAKAYGQLAMILYGYKSSEALSAASKAIEIDNTNLQGHLVIFWDLIDKEEYIEAAKFYQRIAGLRLDDSFLDDGFQRGFEIGEMNFLMRETIDKIQVGLIRKGRPFEAYRLVCHRDPRTHGSIGRDPNDWGYNSSCAAVLAGTGQGVDAPPPADRRAIRKQALEWLTSSFDGWKKQAMALPILGASSAGLMDSPFGPGPLLAASVIASRSPEISRDREAVHARMNEWLSDANLAGVRDDQWLTKLPAEEAQQWRKLWKGVRSLRDQTAPEKPAAKP